MKRLFTTISATLLLLGTTLPLMVTEVDARGSRGGSSFSGSSSKSGSSSSYKSGSSTYKESSSSSNKNSTTDKQNENYSTSNNSTSSSSSNKAFSSNSNSSPSYDTSERDKIQSSGKYYTPPGDTSAYAGKSFFSSGSGIATGLLLGTGAYLLLSGFNDNGDPIYVDSDTNEEVPLSEIEADENAIAVESEAVNTQATTTNITDPQTTTQNVTEGEVVPFVQTATNAEDTSDNDGLNTFLLKLFIGLLGVLVVAFVIKKLFKQK